MGFEIDNSLVGTPIPQMSNLTLQNEKGSPEMGHKTPDTESNVTIDEEELDGTMDTTVKQSNIMGKYEMKPIDIANIGKGINRIKNRLMQGKEAEDSNFDSMEVENNTSLDENSEVWEPTPNGQEALEDTMDTTVEQGARSCVAQRTRSHKDELREKMEENRSLNISKLNKIFKDMKEEDDNIEGKDNRANDSLALPAYRKLHNTIERLDKSFKEKNTIEKSKVTWKDLESRNLEENKDTTKPENLTFLMEDENYKTALEMISEALGTLLEMKLDTVNMDYMESIVRYILYICLDYNINTGNIQESMLEMGRQIRDYQLNSEILEVTKMENNRLNSEIKIQTNIADNYKALWEVYKKNAAGKAKDAKGDEVELTKRLVELEKELDKTTERYRSMFLKSA